MIFLIALSHVLINLAFAGLPFSQSADPCEEAKAGTLAASLTAKDSSFNIALANIKNAFLLDRNEHCISFGNDTAGHIISSSILRGAAISGKVPAIVDAFADLHNHPNNSPPDAGDFYGLISINKKNTDYKTRFVVTTHGTVYALLVTNTEAALTFTKSHPQQPPAFAGGPPGFPVAITDEAREMKYRHNCTDEMVLAFILEKYNTGISLLKQQSDGAFRKIITHVSKNGNELVFSVGNCP